MGVAENRERVLAALAAFSRGDVETYLASYAPDAVIHGLPAGIEPNLTGHRAYVTALHTGLPDVRVEIHAMVFEGDQMAARMTYAGTHLGEFRGVPATGRELRWDAMTFRRFDASGLTVERWLLADSLALLQQLGLG